MAIGDAAPYGGTFFFFRSEMDPLNTLWLAPVGSAMAAVSVPTQQGQPRQCDGGEVCGVAAARREASARRGDGSYLSPGGRTACFAAGLILLVSYGR